MASPLAAPHAIRRKTFVARWPRSSLHITHLSLNPGVSGSSWHPDLIELQLAYAERNEVRAAYNRAQRLLERLSDER
jgi:hypothetical protein